MNRGSGSESGARTGANWSRLVCSISVPNYPPPLDSPPVLPSIVPSLFCLSSLILYLRLSLADRRPVSFGLCPGSPDVYRSILL